MAASKSSCCVVSLLLVAMVVMAAMSGVEADCNSLKSGLAPCTGYLLSKSATPPSGACCQKVRQLNANSKGTQRRADCECLKGLAIQLQSVLNQAHATNLPKACGVSLAIPVSPTTDCSKA